MQSGNIAENCGLPTPTSVACSRFHRSCLLRVRTLYIVAAVCDRRANDATIGDRRYSWLKMISEEEARSRILEKIGPLDERGVPLASAIDCFAARDYFARLPLPAFDNSAMDGYAVIASSCKKGNRLRVIGDQPAGPDRKLRLGDGEAVRIFTGAPLPQGTDAIVMQEDVTRDGSD